MRLAVANVVPKEPGREVRTLANDSSHQPLQKDKMYGSYKNTFTFRCRPPEAKSFRGSVYFN